MRRDYQTALGFVAGVLAAAESLEAQSREGQNAERERLAMLGLVAFLFDRPMDVVQRDFVQIRAMLQFVRGAVPQ